MGRKGPGYVTRAKISSFKGPRWGMDTHQENFWEVLKLDVKYRYNTFIYVCLFLRLNIV